MAAKITPEGGTVIEPDRFYPGGPFDRRRKVDQVGSDHTIGNPVHIVRRQGSSRTIPIDRVQCLYIAVNIVVAFMAHCPGPAEMIHMKIPFPPAIVLPGGNCSIKSRQAPVLVRDSRCHEIGRRLRIERRPILSLETEKELLVMFSTDSHTATGDAVLL